MAKTYLDRLLGQHEKILLITRQHWLVLLRSILVELFLIVVIAAIGLAVSLLLPTLAFLPLVVALVLLLVPFLGGLRDTMVWYNREYIVTNRRVIQVAGVFNKDVTDSSLDKVNDVKMDQSAMGRIFDYGDVEILTASELGANLFRMINSPVHFKTAMVNAKEELEAGRLDEHEPVQEDIPTMIARLDQLRQQGVLSNEEFQAKKAQLLAKM